MSITDVHTRTDDDHTHSGWARGPAAQGPLSLDGSWRRADSSSSSSSAVGERKNKGRGDDCRNDESTLTHCNDVTCGLGVTIDQRSTLPHAAAALASPSPSLSLSLCWPGPFPLPPPSPPPLSMAVSRADEEAYQRLENQWQAVAQALARKLRAITGRPTVTAAAALSSANRTAPRHAATSLLHMCKEKAMQ